MARLDRSHGYLQKAIENEVAEYLERHDQRDANGHRQVVHNGRLPEREIMTPLGALKSINHESMIDGQAASSAARYYRLT